MKTILSGCKQILKNLSNKKMLFFKVFSKFFVDQLFEATSQSFGCALFCHQLTAEKNVWKETTIKGNEQHCFRPNFFLFHKKEEEVLCTKFTLSPKEQKESVWFQEGKARRLWEAIQKREFLGQLDSNCWGKGYI